MQAMNTKLVYIVIIFPVAGNRDPCLRKRTLLLWFMYQFLKHKHERHHAESIHKLQILEV